MIVLFEAAASGTPFLSSACGNATEIAEWTGCGKILPVTSADAMAKGIEELLADKAQLKSMAESGFRAWKTRFTWENIAVQYEQVYADLVRCAQIRLR